MGILKSLSLNASSKCLSHQTDLRGIIKASFSCQPPRENFSRKLSSQEEITAGIHFPAGLSASATSVRAQRTIFAMEPARRKVQPAIPEHAEVYHFTPGEPIALRQSMFYNTS